MADPSISGAANALAHHLRSCFPSVPFDTICAITAQHACDPNKCWELVRLEASLPTTTEPLGSGSSNGGFGSARESTERHYQWAPPGSLVRPRGSYVIRRSHDTPPLQPGAMRDTRSCTPPRVSPTRQQVMNPPMMATSGTTNRPQTLDVRPVLQHRSPSPTTYHRLPALITDGAQSCPGTPTGGAPRASIGFAGNIPSLKINYQTNGSHITLTPSTGPNSPTFVVSGQPAGGGKPVYYQLARTTSQGPQAGLVGVQASPSAWQYVRRPSYADVELAQRAAGQQSTQASNTSGLYRDALRISSDNLSDGSSLTPMSSSGTSPVPSSPLIRMPANLVASSPNIRIQLDPRSGGAVISSDAGPSGTTAARIRPKVTFTPMVTFQPQTFVRSGAAFTVSLRQPTPQTPTYDGTSLAKSTALTNAQAEECLKSVLSHQRSRLGDMKKAMTTAKARLQELRTDVESMEQDMTKHRKHSVRSAAVSDEAISSLHRETRESQAEIQTLLRELDLLRHTTGAQGTALNGGGSGADGGGDAEQWSCSLCTFRNHVDVPICELCEMPRVTSINA